MKRAAVFLAAVMVCAALASCGASDPQKIVSDGLGIPVSGGTEQYYTDSHGGFLGDGVTYITLSFEDQTTLDAIKADPRWSPFPLDQTMQTLVYGTENEQGADGPYLTDEDGNSMIPEISDGYYLLIDRQEEKDTDILERYSLNFTAGVYDADQDILYFCQFDT